MDLKWKANKKISLLSIKNLSQLREQLTEVHQEKRAKELTFCWVKSLSFSNMQVMNRPYHQSGQSIVSSTTSWDVIVNIFMRSSINTS